MTLRQFRELQIGDRVIFRKNGITGRIKSIEGGMVLVAFYDLTMVRFFDDIAVRDVPHTSLTYRDLEFSLPKNLDAMEIMESGDVGRKNDKCIDGICIVTDKTLKFI